MRFLNPKTDFAFKRIFGSAESRDILISFLNAILGLAGRDVIVEVTILDPHLAPRIDGLKNSYLDVRVQDQRGFSYIVEMQALNVEGFEKRILYNACKAYVNQLGKGDPYHILTDVVAVTITDFVMFPELSRVVSRFRLRADENPAICHQDLQLVFAELPKFVKGVDALETTLDRWLYFLKCARDLTAIPKSLSVEPAIVKALEMANEGSWTLEELDDLDRRERWIADQRYLLNRVRTSEQKLEEMEHRAAEAARQIREAELKSREAEQKSREAEQKSREAEQKSRDAERRGQADLLLRQLRRRFGDIPPEIATQVTTAAPEQLDTWSERIFDAGSIADLLGQGPGR